MDQSPKSLYSGTAGRCTCGCCGTHYRPEHRAFPTMLAKIRRHMDTHPELVDHGGIYDAIVIGNRLYVIYFT